MSRPVDYIEAQARLRVALNRKSQLEAEIANLQDEVLSLGMTAVEPFRQNPLMTKYCGDPLSAVKLDIKSGTYPMVV